MSLHLFTGVNFQNCQKLSQKVVQRLIGRFWVEPFHSQFVRFESEETCCCAVWKAIDYTDILQP